MNILTFLIPMALLIAASATFAFIWSVRTGQLDDLDTPPRRVLTDDRPPPASYNEGAPRH